MNERINELADQASLYAVSDNSSMLFDVWKQRYTEKFAELIVKECDRYVAEHYDECEPWMQPGDLLKHFGVE